MLVLSLSLIIGNQAAYADVDVWAFYGEIGGSKIDATTTGNAPLSDSAGIFGDGTINNVGHEESYQNIDEANEGGLSGPLIHATCYQGIEDPTDDGVFVWDFNTKTSDWLCIQNQRGDGDLGEGVDDPANYATQPLELQTEELIVLELTELINAGYFNFMFRMSSNSAGENLWVGLSDEGPTTGNGEITNAELSLKQVFAGNDNPGNNFNDVYVSFTPKNFMYITHVTTGGDNLVQQIKAEINPPVVGGHGGPIDKTALMVTGAQLNASWMIPVLISAIGIGVFVVTRK